MFTVNHITGKALMKKYMTIFISLTLNLVTYTRKKCYAVKLHKIYFSN